MMLSQWLSSALVALPMLVIPLAILIGQRVAGGPLVVASGGALLLLAVFWLLGGIGALSRGDSLLPIVSLACGALLLLGAWTLALANAAGARHWGWVGLLTCAAYLTYCTLLTLTISPFGQCVFPSPPRPAVIVTLACPPTNLPLQSLMIAGCFVGPATALAYALRARVLSVSLLDG